MSCRGIGVKLDHNTIVAKDVERAIRKVLDPEITAGIRFGINPEVIF